MLLLNRYFQQGQTARDVAQIYLCLLLILYRIYKELSELADPLIISGYSCILESFAAEILKEDSIAGISKLDAFSRILFAAIQAQGHLGTSPTQFEGQILPEITALDTSGGVTFFDEGTSATEIYDAETTDARTSDADDYASEKPDARTATAGTSRDPSILQVNQQSRHEALRLFKERRQLQNEAKYICPSFDILYFDLFCDARCEKCLTEENLARLKSVREIEAIEHIVLRMKKIPHVELHFFIKALLYIRFFPKLLIVTVVVDGSDPMCKPLSMKMIIRYGAGKAIALVTSWKVAQGIDWKQPEVEVITEWEFNERYIELARDTCWSKTIPLKTEEVSLAGDTTKFPDVDESETYPDSGYCSYASSDSYDDV
ncbi:uncharacterized protein RCO7_08928 [Rhynchosporium graminicola]|uniref:Uncharacterized protein n=1 Tax=Rhynchosporium graminicola TaxID=2792576 RepID=A0A1E1KJN2_9HELO|nr:uncharacterized protein RCO7_08928 [Rhynchosporium commune]